MSILLHVLIDHFDFAVVVEAKLMHDQVPFVLTKVVGKHGNEIFYWALDVALTVCCALIVAGYVFVVADFLASQIILQK